MVTESDVKTAKEQARDVGLALLLLLSLRDMGRDVRFDASRGMFIVDGKPVGVRAMRRLTAAVEKTVSTRVRKLVADLFAGKITLAEWRTRMQSEVAAAHLLMAALASGSIEKAVGSLQVRERIAKEKDHVYGFAGALKSGKLSLARAGSRAASYALAAAATFGIVEQAVQGMAGKREAKRIRRALESCKGCLAFAGRWMPIQMMPPIGSLECGSHCRCYLIYR